MSFSAIYRRPCRGRRGPAWPVAELIAPANPFPIAPMTLAACEPGRTITYASATTTMRKSTSPVLCISPHPFDRSGLRPLARDYLQPCHDARGVGEHQRHEHQ